MHIFNIHTNIQQNKRLLTQKPWEELARKHLSSNKGAKLKQERSEWYENFATP
jgi:hypothetical protein